MSNLPPEPQSEMMLQYGGYCRQCGSSRLAVACLVVGIISIPLTVAVWCLGIPIAIVAIILGNNARYEARRGMANGAGMALAELICGYVSVVLAVGLIAVALIAMAVHG